MSDPSAKPETPRTPAPKPGPATTKPKPPQAKKSATEASKEIGGRDGPEPTRYGDWEVNGICVDF